MPERPLSPQGYNIKDRPVNTNPFWETSPTEELGGVTAEASTLEMGEPATATVESVRNPSTGKTDLRFSFGIPEGMEGPPGADGRPGAAGPPGADGRPGVGIANVEAESSPESGVRVLLMKDTNPVTGDLDLTFHFDFPGTRMRMRELIRVDGSSLKDRVVIDKEKTAILRSCDFIGIAAGQGMSGPLSIYPIGITSSGVRTPIFATTWYESDFTGSDPGMYITTGTFQPASDTISVFYEGMWAWSQTTITVVTDVSMSSSGALDVTKKRLRTAPERPSGTAGGISVVGLKYTKEEEET